MLIRVVLTAFVFLWAFEASATKPPVWQKRIHTDSVRAASIRGALGVSNDSTSVVVWSALTGDSIAHWPNVRGQVQQAWLVADVNTVIAIVKPPVPTTEQSVVVYWLRISTREIYDSLVLSALEPPVEIFSDMWASSDISKDGRLLAVSVYRKSTNANANLSTVLRIVDLDDKSIVSSETRHASIQFESKDSRVRSFEPDAHNGHVRSPSGAYTFNSNKLINYPTNGAELRLTKEWWFVIRWGQIDAVFLGRIKNPGVWYETPGPVCLLNICTDVIIDTIADTSYGGFTFWSDSDLTTAVAFSPFGDVATWTLPDISRYNDLCVAKRLPDTVKADSVYEVRVVWLPYTANEQYVVDPGDGRKALNTHFMSWEKAGVHRVRFGRVDAPDTVWTVSQDIVVLPKVQVPNSTDALKLNDGIQHIDATRSNALLITTQYGRVFIADENLSCNQGYRTSRRMNGAAWDSDTSVIDLSYHIYGRRNYSPHTYDGIVEAKVRRVNLTDFRIRDSVVKAIHFESDYEWAGIVNKVDVPIGDDMWFAVSKNDTLSSEGYLMSLKHGNTLDTTLRAHRYSNDTPSVLTTLGVPAGGAVNSTRTYAIVLQHNNHGTPGPGQRILIVDLSADTCVAALDSTASGSAMFITDDVAIIDSAIIRINPLTIISKHQFKGPFARTSPTGYAIAWHNGKLYTIAPDGGVRDSIAAGAQRPTAIAALQNKTIAAGYGAGLLVLHDATKLDATDSQSPNQPKGTFTMTCAPQPAHTSFTIRTTMPRIANVSTLTLLDMTGRVVTEWQLPSANEYAFDLANSNVTAGVYVLWLRCAQNSASTLMRVVR